MMCAMSSISAYDVFVTPATVAAMEDVETPTTIKTEDAAPTVAPTGMTFTCLVGHTCV